MPGPAGWGRTPSTSRHRRTPRASGRRIASTSTAGSRPNGDGVDLPDGTSTTTTSQSPASLRFMVLPTPPSMYRRSPIVTGGHAPGTAQLAATASTSSTPDVAVEGDQLAGADVDRGDPQLAVRPVVRRQPLGDHLAADRLGHGGGGVCDRPDALQLLRRRGVGVRERVEKQLGDVVDVDAGVDLLRCARDLTVVQLVEARSRCRAGRRPPNRPMCRAARRNPAARAPFPPIRLRCPAECRFPRRFPPGPRRPAPAPRFDVTDRVCQAGDNRPGRR